jgi:hypothetical protein
MGFEASWLIEKRVALVSFSGVVTVEDAAAATQASIRLISEGTAPVHMINDTTDVEKFPPLLELREVGARESHPNTGWTVMVVTHPVLRFIVSILLQLARTKYRLAGTRQEAIDFIVSRDSTLPAQNARSI